METEYKIGQCPRCLSRDEDKSEKKLFHCGLCDVWYCEKHILPKPCYIVDLGKPDKDPTKWQYLNDDGLGHPDASYIERQGALPVSQSITPTKETKLPEPPVVIPIKAEEKRNRVFGTCPKCKCTDSDIIKDYPHKAILKCWNCYLKYGQRKYPPYHYIRLRIRKYPSHHHNRHQTREKKQRESATKTYANKFGHYFPIPAGIYSIDEYYNRLNDARTLAEADEIIDDYKQGRQQPAKPTITTEYNPPSPPIVNRKKENAAKKAIIAGAIIVSLLATIFFSGALNYVGSQNLTPSPTSPPFTSSISPPTVSPFSTTIAPPVTSAPTPQNLLVNPKTMHYHYTLRGVSSELTFTVYGGMYDHLVASEDSTVTSYFGQQQSPEEIDRIVTLRYVNESVEQGELHNLALAIEQITPNEDDQARIAISLVQNIPYDWNAFTTNNVQWKYPYEVLYSNTGVCSQKSMLLVCLLRELGYGCSILEFSNHAAVGISCPSQYAYYSGYAFVESTSPTIITDCYENYVSSGKLPSSPSYVIVIQEGKVMNSVSEVYQDCQTYRSLINMGSVLDESHYAQWQALVSKYGIQVS